MDGRDNRRFILHMMAGIYLLYLTYHIITGILSGQTPENRAVMMWISAVAFGVIGAILVVHALIARVKESKNDSAEAEEMDDTDEESEEAAEELPEEKEVDMIEDKKEG